jgi:hypothetical protein
MGGKDGGTWRWSLAEAALIKSHVRCAKNLSFVRRQGWSVRSEVGGRWKGFSPGGGNPCSD